MHNITALFSSFFESSNIPDYIKYYLSSLKVNCTHVVFIKNNNPLLSADSERWLHDRSIEIFYVENDGLDFGMWQKALIKLGPKLSDTLCLCNDSCILFKPLDSTFLYIKNKNHDAFGLVKSYETSEHLQSYFLVFKGKAKDKAVSYILSQDFSQKTYDYIVSNGEIGLSKHLINESFNLYSIYSSSASSSANPSFIFCDDLINRGMPMIKRKALGYPPGYLLRNFINEGKGLPSRSFSKSIMAATNYNSKIAHFITQEKKFSLREEIKLYRRILKFSASNIIRKLLFRT